MQPLAIEEVCDVLAEHVTDPERKRRQARMRGACAILQRLMGFPGETWEQRWLASGCDAAPRGWIDYLDAPSYEHGRPRCSECMRCCRIERSDRPTAGYSTLADRISTRTFLHATGGSALAKLRRLTDYQTALPRQQHDAEAGLARVMIRTGKEIEQITGDDLLYYADVVKTSGRNRREHLLWELLVQLGPLAGEAPTLRAAWSAKGNSRQHSTATLVNRYSIPASGVRDLLVDYLEEVRPGMDYASLEGLAYRLARLFWWEVLQVNPEQADLRLAPEVATAWRERLSLTTDGSAPPRDPFDLDRDPQLLPRSGRVVSRRPRALGRLGFALSSLRVLFPARRRRSSGARKARCATTHADAHPAVAGLRCGRERSEAPHCAVLGAGRSVPGRGRSSKSMAARSFAIRHQCHLPTTSGCASGRA